MKAYLIEAAKAVVMLLGIVLFLGAVMYLACAPAHAQERTPFSAQATLQRAQVGTYSARLAPPVRVELETTAPARHPRVRASDFERTDTYLSCRVNPAEPKTVICEPRSYL